ncbi:MAG: ComEC/Rec2 family competence protein [Chloroflexi bacterium]|nr:ComEC/Rec2 family competence protein [Chloroflexota bacterium]
MPTIAVALAWLVAVMWAAWSWPGGLPAAVCAGATIGAVAFHRRPAPAVLMAAVCAGVALVASARWEAVTSGPPSDVARLIDAGRVRLYGTVRADGEERERSMRLRVDVTEVVDAAGQRKASGGVLVQTALGRSFRAGDRVEVEGRLTAPPDLPNFDYRAYLARQGIDARMDYPRVRVVAADPAPAMARWLRDARRAASRALDRALPQPEAALARGIVVGDRVAIPAAVTDDFNRSGTSHLIAISGFNITLVIAMATGMLVPLLGRRPALIGAMALITVYALFVGMTPSVVRALVMGAIVVGGALLGRPGAPLVALLLAATAMTAHDPRVIDDAGFQLSFVATAGIMLLAPALSAAGNRVLTTFPVGDRLAGAGAFLWEPVAVTLAATVATLPVMLYTFGRVSLVAPLANLVLVPLFPLVMITSGAAALAGSVLPAGAALAGALAWPPLAFTVAVAHLAAQFPAASLDTGYASGGVVAAMAVTVGAAIVAVRSWSRTAATEIEVVTRPRLSPVLLVAGAPVLLVAAYLTGMIVTADSADGRLTVTFGEAGGSVVALVTGPGGERILVDTGPSAAAIRRAVDPLLPAGDRSVALVILTRRAPTTTGGLPEVVETYRPGAVAGPRAGDTDEQEQGQALAVRFTELEAGSTIRLSDGAYLEIEQDVNDRERLAIVAVMGNRRIGITAGTEADAGRASGGTSPSRVALYAGGSAMVDYEIRPRGAIHVSTDGAGLRLESERGDLLPLKAEVGRGRRP